MCRQEYKTTGSAPVKTPQVVLLPDTPGSMIRKELAHAFNSRGRHVHILQGDAASPQHIARMLALPPGRSGLPAHPGLFCSVNFQGMDKHGELFAVLKNNGIPAAVWCVDNPWNLLSGLRSPFWKETFLFVSDHSFIADLNAAGAQQVRHMPLAADPDIFHAPKATWKQAALRPFVFVGRSAFPDKKRFFTGQGVPESLLRRGQDMLEAGERPDFSWWWDKLGLLRENTPMWPGSAVRRAGLGAETCSLAWRMACLSAALPHGLTLIGDEGWRHNFASAHPAPDLRPPADYYAHVPAIYAQAEFSLNMTSLLLPAGLTQRHFDVWAAGGFCLTDATPGLRIFPPELTAPVTFASPKHLPETALNFMRHPREKARIAKLWQEHILREHCYGHRADSLLVSIFTH